jgi:predicted transposase/invertase (TIGR01784 family)
MAQDYDKIFREVLKDIFPAVAQKVLGIPAGQFKPLPVDLQYTSEREADQLWEVTPPDAPPFVVHCEFQSSNDKQMLSRMLLYYAFLYYQQKRPVRQYVIYVGKNPVQMDFQLQSESLSYSYQLIDLKAFPYQTFLESTHTQEVVLAILADFRGEPGELIAGKIIAKLEQYSAGKLELSQRAAQLIRLAILRNLGETVFNLAKKMPITIDIKEDIFYREGMQQGLQQGMQQGKEEGELEGKEKTALNMLREGFSEAIVSRLTELPLARVTQLKEQLAALDNREE